MPFSSPSGLGTQPVAVRRREVGLLESRSFRESATAVVVHAILVAGAIVIMIPLFWMISTSLKAPGEVFAFPPKWIPSPLRFENYVVALSAEPFHLFFVNTTFITGMNVIGQLFSVTVVAFAFARLRWWGRDLLFLVMLSTLMLPSQVTLIPQFVLFKQLNWVDSFYPLWVPAFFGQPFLCFLARQFYMTISLDLDDAARIDGCSTLGIYWRIILPLGKPVLATIAIFTFNWNWNDFLGPLIYLNTKEKFTLSLGLTAFQSAQRGTDFHLLMAASLVVMLPVIVLFFFAQKYFIQGVVFTGVKG